MKRTQIDITYVIGDVSCMSLPALELVSLKCKSFLSHSILTLPIQNYVDTQYECMNEWIEKWLLVNDGGVFIL